MKDNERRLKTKGGQNAPYSSSPFTSISPQPIAHAPPKLIITRSKSPPKNSCIPPVIRISAPDRPFRLGTTHVHPSSSSIWSCMTTSTAASACDDRRKLDHGKKNCSAITASELSPMGFDCARKCFSNPSSPNFLQPKPFEFGPVVRTASQRLTKVKRQQRPTSTSRFVRCQTIDSALNNCAVNPQSRNAKVNFSEFFSRSLSPSRFPHDLPPKLSTEIQIRSKSSFNISAELLQPTVKPISLRHPECKLINHLAPTARPNNGRKKQFSPGVPMSRKSCSPTSRFFPILESQSICHQSDISGQARNLTERWQIKGDSGFHQLRGTRIGTKMNFSKNRDEASSSSSRSGRNAEECYRMVELRRNILEVESETGRGSIDSDNSINSGSLWRYNADERSTSSAASMRVRMSLLGKSLSIDPNSDNPIPCRDFGIRDYLTMTGESIDNEEESSLAGDFATGLGVIPPRFSIDSIDSQIAILQELKESRNSFSTSSSSAASSAAPIKEIRRYSEDIGMLSSAAQRRNPPISPPSLRSLDIDARNHGELNSSRVEDAKDSNKQFSEGRPQLHKSISTPHPSNVITRSTLPKIQEDRYAVRDKSQVLRDSVDVNSSERECARLRAESDTERRTSGDVSMRTWRLTGTLDELEDDDQYWQDMDQNDVVSATVAENGKK